MAWRTRIVNDTKKRYKPYLTRLSKLIVDYQSKENALLEEFAWLTEQEQQDSDYQPVVWCMSLIKDLQNLQNGLTQYMEQVVVLGYN